MNRDIYIEAMEFAQEAWRDSAFLSTTQKIALGAQLNRYRVFSTMQIAKLVRISHPSALKYGYGRNIPGGRFEPQALSSLTILRKQYKVGPQEVSKPLVRLCFDSGCSYGVIRRLTGIPITTLHRYREGK